MSDNWPFLVFIVAVVVAIVLAERTVSRIDRPKHPVDDMHDSDWHLIEERRKIRLGGDVEALRKFDGQNPWVKNWEDGW